MEYLAVARGSQSHPRLRWLSQRGGTNAKVAHGYRCRNNDDGSSLCADGTY
jgi:hypothetical protein